MKSCACELRGQIFASASHLKHHMGLVARKHVFEGRRGANNTGADQPAPPRSLICAFVVRILESFICKLATGEISIF